MMEKFNKFKNIQVIYKGWGREEIIHSSPLYCLKKLHFNEGKSFSLHYHGKKTETWLVINGMFRLMVIDTINANQYDYALEEGDAFHVPVLLPHKLTCVKGPGLIIEASTEDDPHDSYRIAKGDSQKKD